MLQAFLNQRVPPQLGITIFLILSFLFLIFLFWNLETTQREILSLENFSAFPSGKWQYFAPTGLSKEVIKISVNEKFANLEQKTFWQKEDFLKILAEKEKFEKAEISHFRRNISQSSQGKISVSDFKVDFVEEENSVILSCVLGGVKTPEGFYDFGWLLKKFQLDLSQFQKFENELFFSGEIGETKFEIEIIFSFPIEISGNKIFPR